MAMQLVAWELRSAWLEDGGRLREPPWDRPWAQAGAVEGLVEHLASTLALVGFTDRRDPGQVVLRLRRLLYRTRLDQVEVNILRGFCTRIERLLGAPAAPDDRAVGGVDEN
jgi:tRNA C32,U32 (ribose-2'-O)-methylase TrmJ